MAEHFRQVLVSAMKDGPWTALSEAQLDGVAAQLGASDIIEIIDALDQLSREKEALPDWDGDAQDDIARAQALFARILARMKAEHGPAIAARLAFCEPTTRDYLRLALA